MCKLALLAVLVWTASFSPAAAPEAKKVTVSKASKKQVLPAKKTSSKKVSGKSTSRRKPRRAWSAGQQAPTPERYRQIQQALVDRGYLDGPVTGTWGLESEEALKRFQKDQNLDARGKLDSLSLIALGLGPKRDTAAVTEPKAPQ